MKPAARLIPGRMWRAGATVAIGAAVGAVVVVLVVGCAKRGLPPGGPEDKTAPVVAEMVPASGGVSVDLSSEIRLGFSEPMKQRTVESAVVVSPPTRWAKRYWQDATYVMVPAQPLQAGTTYLVSVGATAVDRHGVKMAKTYVAGFSTGATIEAGVISGKVAWKGMSVEQGVVEVFDSAEIGEVTGFPTADPDYVSLTGTGGAFEIPYVNPRIAYRLFAFIDKDGSGAYEKGEVVGCAGGEFTFADSSRISGVEIVLCNEGLMGSLTGQVEAPDSTAKTAVVALAANDSVAYRATPGAKGEFSIGCMKPGRYRLQAFVDYNGNQRRDVVDTLFAEFGDTVAVAPCAKPPRVEISLKR